MFPGFVHMYKDDEAFVHLYFFSGISDNDDALYKNIDLTNVPFTYTCTKSEDNLSFDYKFDNKSIIKIKCQLVKRQDGKVEKKILTLKKK